MEMENAIVKQYIKYIILNLAAPTLLITLTLTGIIWLTQSLRFVDMIVNRGLGFMDFLYLSSLLLPSLLLIILPIALFTAVIFTYNKLIVDSEMVVLRSAGLNRFSLAFPALIVAAVLTIFSYIISLYLLPTSYRNFKDTQAFIRDNYASVLLQEGVFNNPTKGLTVYIDERQDNGMLRGIMVHDNRDVKNPITMMAQEGKLIQTPKGPRFDLINGNRQEINHKDGQLSLLYFDRYTLDISVYTKTQETRWREPKERYLHELLYPEAETPEHLISKLLAEAHQRLTWPIYNIALTLIALCGLLSGQFNRRGQWKRILSATGVTIVTVAAGLSITNIIANSPALAPLPYMLIIIIISFCFYILVGKRPIMPALASIALISIAGLATTGGAI